MSGTHKSRELFDEFCKRLNPEDVNIYKGRFEYELNVIQDSGLSYLFEFLRIIRETVREKNILHSPGMGYLPCSFLSYLYGVTFIDPVQSGFAFERFIVPEKQYDEIIVVLEGEHKGIEVLMEVLTKKGAEMKEKSYIGGQNVTLNNVDVHLKKNVTLQEFKDYLADANNQEYHNDIWKLTDSDTGKCSRLFGHIVEEVSKYDFFKNISPLVLDKKEPIHLSDLAMLYAHVILASRINDGLDHYQIRTDELKRTLEESLKDTHGELIFQEQLLHLAVKFGGFSLKQADKLRRALGKKKADEVHQFKAVFIINGEAAGYSHLLLTALFDLMADRTVYLSQKAQCYCYALILLKTFNLIEEDPLRELLD